MADFRTKANAFLDKKEYQKAPEHHQKAITDPNLAKAWINKGIVLQTYRYSESLREIDVSINIDPGNAVA
jgi:tetratricopeptide (TPR) repeat protein